MIRRDTPTEITIKIRYTDGNSELYISAFSYNKGALDVIFNS